jgi:ubiquinone/menaquinone biosynthesis C-methylase UbiE
MAALLLDKTPVREESPGWLEAFGAQSERARRRKAMPRKLAALGAAGAPRQASILDMCCGYGEAIEALYDMGFRRLAGIDIHVPEALKADGRFDVCAGDAKHTPWPEAGFDWVLNIHAMHHLGMPPDIRQFLDECWRLLRPGGRLGIIDFPNSVPIRLAFWWFRQGRLMWTPYLRNFSRMIREEWCFLKDYLPRFGEVRKMLYEGPFQVERRRRGLFYFYLTLRKPGGDGS